MVYYYKNKFPSKDDIISAKVINISEYGVEVSLNEYNDLKGFINCNEISRKKRINIHKLLSIDKEVILHVVNVNEQQQLVDLSKKSIRDEDILNFTKKYKLHIQLYNIFKQFYMKLYNFDSLEQINEIKLYEFMNLTLWKIQLDYENEYILEKILNKKINIEINNSINFDYDNFITKDHFTQVLNDYIKNKINRIKPELVENIKLMTYNSSGLADIKYSLDFKNFMEYEKIVKDFDIKINYISGSNYSIILEQKEFDLTSDITINDALLLIKKEIKNRSNEKSIQNQIII